MTHQDLEQRLAAMVAFQCALLALRGVPAEASEEMLWQALLAALVEQYGFRRVWYGRWAGGRVRPSACMPSRGLGLPDLPDGMHADGRRSEEHTSELQSPCNLVCRLLLEKKKKQHHSWPHPEIPVLAPLS